MEQIKNDQLTLEISPLGAELQSIKDANGNEYLWDGDEKYWNRHSPILFPIVCGLWKDTYRIEGKEYHLSRHGFARDTEFQLVGKTADRLTFALIDSEETQKNYPYHFNLAISYRLEGNEIHVIWHVENTDDKEIMFQIGGHPAFLVPGCKKGEEMKATLKLDNEAPVRLFGNVGGCIDRQAKETVKTGHLGSQRRDIRRRRRHLRQEPGEAGNASQRARRATRHTRIQDTSRRHLEPYRQARSFHLHRTMVWFERLGRVRR